MPEDAHGWTHGKHPCYSSRMIRFVTMSCSDTVVVAALMPASCDFDDRRVRTSGGPAAAHLGTSTR
jgi:hypothetical protein